MEGAMNVVEGESDVDASPATAPLASNASQAPSSILPSLQFCDQCFDQQWKPTRRSFRVSLMFFRRFRMVCCGHYSHRGLILISNRSSRCCRCAPETGGATAREQGCEEGVRWSSSGCRNLQIGGTRAVEAGPDRSRQCGGWETRLYWQGNFADGSQNQGTPGEQQQDTGRDDANSTESSASTAGSVKWLKQRQLGIRD
jgi:hypothetical protein